MVSWIVTVVLFIILTILMIKSFFKYFQFRRMVDRCPGPPVSSVLMGNLPFFWKILDSMKNLSTEDKLREYFKTIIDIYKRYQNKGVVRIWLGPVHPIFILTSVDNVEKLLTSSTNINKALTYKIMEPWLGDGLLLSPAHKWRPRRKIYGKAFHFKILESFLPIFAKFTDRLLTQIDDSMCHQHNKTKQPRQLDENNNNKLDDLIINDIKPFYEDCTLSIINETAMGVIDEDHLENNESYVEALKQAMRSASNRTKRPAYWLDFTFKLSGTGRTFFKAVGKIHDYTDSIIRRSVLKQNFEIIRETDPLKKLNDYKDDDKKPKIFLDILLKHSQENSSNFLTQKTMRSEINTFILGGFDTTAMALTFSTLLLGHHQEIQEKVREELSEVLGPDPNQQVTFEDLKQLRYLEMCIKESLRIFPSIQLVGRRITETLKLKNDFQIPAGCDCFIPIVALHNDPRYFPNPNIFDPDRFSSDQDSKQNPFAYIPFSAGSRNCIGQKYALIELKFILSCILRRYRIHSITPINDISKEFMPVLKPRNKITVKFEKLQTKC